MKTPKTNSNRLRAGLFLFLLITLTFCKKDTLTRSSFSSSDLPPGISAKLFNTYSGVQFNNSLGMLSFADLNAYNNTKTKLIEELELHLPDNGYTSYLLSILDTATVQQVITDSLIHNSPLSDTVMLKYLSLPNNSFAGIKSVIEACNILTPRQLTAVSELNLNETEMLQLENILVHRKPYVPGLSEFEGLFSGYTSYRKKNTQNEIDFLALGNDPESSNNPINSAVFDVIDGTLYNEHGEVKIGDKIIKIQPHRTIYIIDSQESESFLNILRSTGEVPFNTPPQNEPSNGFNIMDAPKPVSDKIIVEAMDYNPIGQSRLLISSSPSNNAFTYNFSCNVTGSGYKYYWDFGDGKVSYLANPVHTFDGVQDIHVTLRVYDSHGVSVFEEIGNFNPQLKSDNCSLHHTMLANQSAGLLASVTIYVSDANYDSSNPLSLLIHWGDQLSFVQINLWQPGWHTIQHTYSNYGTYQIQSYFYHSGVGVICNSEMQTSNFQLIDPNSEPSCCVKRDRHKEVWKSDGLTNKYKHITKLKNNLVTKGSVDTELHTYHKVKFWFLHFWFATNATATVSVSGNWYVPCTNLKTEIACNGTSSIFSETKTSTWYIHNLNKGPGSNCHVYLKQNGMLSTATAFGVTSQLKLPDECYEWDYWHKTFPNWPF